VEVTPRPDSVPLKPKADPAFRYFTQLISTPAALEHLAKHGLVVDGNRAYDEFFQLYEQNRYRPLLIDSKEVNEDDEFIIKRHFLASVPSVVTPDVVLHNLHLFFDFALATAEVEQLAPALLAVIEAALDATSSQREALAGTPWADAAADNLAFLEVARVLLAAAVDPASLAAPPEESEESAGMVGIDTEAQTRGVVAVLQKTVDSRLGPGLSPEVRRKAKVELGRVLAAQGPLPLTLFSPPKDFLEDYSMYTPRGHYVKSPALTAYFLGVMWLSRVPLFFSSEPAVRSAALLALAVSSPEATSRWRAVHEAISFLVGPPDDVTFVELAPVLERVSRRGALNEDAVFAELRRELTALEPPRVQSARTATTGGPSLESQRALHFLSQRAVIDAVLLQGLVMPQVPKKDFVRALEVPAVLGSAAAAAVLEREGLATRFEGYEAQRARLAESLRAELDRRKGQEFVAGWLAALAPLLGGPATVGPRFMQTEAYGVLRLSTWLASYAELKHDTVLYAKQGVAEMGGPGFEDTEDTIDDRGYVVPEVDVYARVGFLLRRLREGLSERGLFPSRLEKSWTRFEALAAALEAISRKELAGQALTTEEYHLIKFIGGDLEHFWEETLINRANLDRWMLLNENNSRIIADIFTGPAGITHVASGWVHPVYVAFPRDGKVAIGRGGVLSFYEVNSGERLSDQAWRRLLADERPPLPEWTRPAFVQDPRAGLSVFDAMSEE
jgi:hypothetical protein